MTELEHIESEAAVKSPFQHPVCLVSALVFTVLLSLMVMPLKEGKYRWVYGIINERGPLPFLIFFSTTFNLTAYAIARLTRSFPACFSRQLLVYSFFPLAFGTMGTIMGFGAAISGFSEFMAGATELEQIKEAQGNVLIGLGVAFDTMLIGIMCTLLSLGSYCSIIGIPNRPGA